MQARPVQGVNPDRLDIMAQKSSPSPAARFFGNDDWDAPAEQHTPAPAAGTEDPGLSTAALEESVRPRSLDDFIGQEELRANLRVYLGAARERGCALDHTLFYGNPGLGKTTLAQIMAAELGVNLVCTSGPVLERSGDLAAILTNLSRNDILFVDVTFYYLSCICCVCIH